MTARDPAREGSPRRSEEGAFLTGPDGRVTELRRAVHVFGDLLRGFRALHFAGPCVTVFGSARLGEGHPYYDLGRAVGAEMARAGLTVMTGGGPGLMEAASRGAREAGGRTVACTVEPTRVQKTNPHVDREVHLRYSFVRKAMLVKYSVAFVALPGGFATMEEIFESLALSRDGRIADFPIVLLGERYWRPLLEQIGASMVGEALVDATDLERILITDSPEAATRCVLRWAGHRFGLKLLPPPARRPLGERALRGRRTTPFTHRLLGRRRLDLRPPGRRTP